MKTEDSAESTKDGRQETQNVCAPSSDFGFLFRTDQGRIDRQVWRRYAFRLFAVVAVMFALWPLLAPYTIHDLAKTISIKFLCAYEVSRMSWRPWGLLWLLNR